MQNASAVAVLIALGFVAACGSDAAAPSGEGVAPAGSGGLVDGGPGASDAARPTDAADAALDAAPVKGPPPSALPVTFQRPDVGVPLTPAELAAATDELIALLKDTRYFDFVDERVHGWPETDPAKGYWYGHFWTSIAVTKESGVVTYKHANVGADNVGIHTAPYLEGTCYGYLMWGDGKVGHLTQRMARAYTGWIKAMVRTAGDTNPTLLARSFYRPNVTSTEGGRNLHIDYSASYPGVSVNVSDYVHVPANPTFGDIYIKNKRSKDDIGQMLRSMTQVKSCAPRLDAAAQADFAEMKALYESWAARVDAQGFAIETLDTAGNLWSPPDQLAHYSLVGNLECLGALATRLKWSGAPGSLACGSGLSPAESVLWTSLQNDAREIVRTNHAAALVLAYEKAQPTLALELLKGLSQRVELDMAVVESASPPATFRISDVASELVYAASTGVPLTSREVRWLHGRLHQAYVGLRDPALATMFNVFAATTPDGSYLYDPPILGMEHRDIGMLLGACASTYRNPAGRSVLDCNRLLQAF